MFEFLEMLITVFGVVMLMGGFGFGVYCIYILMADWLETIPEDAPREHIVETVSYRLHDVYNR